VYVTTLSHTVLRLSSIVTVTVKKEKYHNMNVCNCSPAYYLSAYNLEKPLVIVPNAADLVPPWRDRSIVGPKLRLVELLAFVERQQEGEAVSF